MDRPMCDRAHPFDPRATTFGNRANVPQIHTSAYHFGPTVDFLSQPFSAT